MAIQNRRGNEADFIARRMLPGEFAVSLDQNILRLCFSSGVVKQIALTEDVATALSAMNTTLDGRITPLETASSNNTTAIGLLTIRVNNAESAITDHAGRILVLEQDSTGIKARLDDDEDTLSQVSELVDSMNLDLIDVTDDVTNLKSNAVRFDTSQSKTTAQKLQARLNMDAAKIASLASAFSTSTTYAAGDYCTYNGALYRFTAAHTGSWNNSHATEVAVGGELADLKEDLSDITNTQQISFTDKHYIATNKSVGQTVDLTPVSNNAFSYAIVNCTEGDIITLNAVGWTTGRLWAFLDSNNVVLTVSNASVTADGLTIIAPQDAAKCVINSYTQNLGVCYAGASIDYKISKNDDKIEFIDKSINKIIVNTDAIDVTNWAQGYINSQGGVTSDNKYVTSNNLFTFEDDVYITVAEGLSLAYGLYSGSSASDYDGNSSKVYVSGNECVIPYVSGKYYRFQLSKTDGTNLAKADVPAHALSYYYKVYTDVTLTKTGKSADAKVVGDSIAPQKSLGSYSQTDVTLTDSGTGFITTAGTINGNSGYKYTTPIAVSSGDVIEISAWGTSGVVILAKTNANADFYTTLMVGDASTNPKFYAVTFDGYVTVSYNNNYTVYVKKHNTTSITAIANNYNPVDVTVKTNKFLSNPLVESMTHQGFSLGHGKNALSSFWGGYLKGFDTMLCNVRWTADSTPVPVCEHDASFTDSVTGNTITIAETTYAELAEARRNGEVVPKFEDVVYMAKMLGMPVMAANVPGANETEKWSIIWGILDKYRMTSHMQWVATESAADIILAHNPDQTILFYLSTFSAENLNTLVTSVNAYADQHPDSKFVVWVPAAGANVETLKTALASANLNLHTNVKMGLCNIETENYVDLIPYVDVFHSDTIATGSMIPGIVSHLSQKYPQISPYVTYNYVKDGR